MNDIKQKNPATISILSYPDLEKDSRNVDHTIQYNSKSKMSGKKKALISIGILIGTLILLLLTIIIINLNADYIFNNIFIDGSNVSHLTSEQAIQKITEEKNALLSNKIAIVYNDMKKEVSGKDVNGQYNITNAVEQAYNIGRQGNIFSNNIDMLQSNFEETNISCDYTYDENKLNDILNSIISKLPKLQEATYTVNDDNIVITKGNSGIVVDEQVLKQQIIEAMKNGNTDDIPLSVTTVYPKKINLEKIRNEIYKPAVDATYKTDPFEIIPHQVGVDFGISLEDAKALLNEDKEKYVIPLAYTTPSITVENIGTEAFPDLLSSFETRYNAYNYNRSNNLLLASNSINGSVVMPGEVFSYNQTLGPRTYERGYKDAGIYSGGKVVNGVGGGICQVSSTLYNIVLLANLEIIERHNHQFLPGYVGAGRDATVVWGALDFKFKNTRKYPVRIESSVGGGIITMKLWGLKEENEYDVTFDTTILSTLYAHTVYEDTYSLAPGETKITSGGQNGCKSVTYRILSQNGVEVSREQLSSDTYSAMNSYGLRGIGQSAPEPEPQEEESSSSDTTVSSEVDSVSDSALQTLSGSVDVIL